MLARTTTARGPTWAPATPGNLNSLQICRSSSPGTNPRLSQLNPPPACVAELRCARSGFGSRRYRRCPADFSRTHRAGLSSESRDHHQYASISAGPARSGGCGQTAPRWVWTAYRKMILLHKKNASRPWEPEEEKQLREMAEAGKTITMIALRLKRTVTAVRCRLSTLKISLHKLGRLPRENPPA